MEPFSRDKPFDDPDFLYQIKWDGVRYLAFIDGKEIRLQNRKLKVKTGIYPEFQSLASHFKGKRGILDGEIIAIGEKGVPSFPKILRRDLLSRFKTSYQREIPAYFMIFDIIFLEEKDLTSISLIERQEILKNNLVEGEEFYLTENHEEGVSLFEVMQQKGMEGIVAKRKQSLYRVGEKSRDWLKIKVSRFQDCLVGGYVLKKGRVSSLLVGAHREGVFLYLGRVSSGLKEEELKSLHKELYSFRKENSSFNNTPITVRGEEIIWLEPTLGVKVEFMEWTPDLKLRSPRIAGFLTIEQGIFQI